MHCALCDPFDEQILWQDTRCRIILVDDPHYPGYCRVIWHDHVREMTDLDCADRQHLMSIVMVTESAIRTLMQPVKINLASLGNKVSHLHWHVIPRFIDDPHFPESVWSTAQRTGTPSSALDVGLLKQAIEAEINRAIPATVSTDQKNNSFNQKNKC